MSGRAASDWAVAGVALLFAHAVLQLGVRGLATLSHGLSGVQWLALLVLTAAFVYGEGVRALERRYVPHLLQRVQQLAREDQRRFRLLAPLYAMTLVGAPARRLAFAWAGVAAIILAVIIVRAFPQPWRGIVDFAVAAALLWGLVAMLRGASRMRRSTV